MSVTTFAQTNFRNNKQAFGIKLEDRFQHTHILGKTGVGKSVLIQNKIISDIQAGHGVCYIDPHGDSMQTILRSVPKHRVKDVVYFNPSDPERSTGINIFRSVSIFQRSALIEEFIDIFKRLNVDVKSEDNEQETPRMEHYLRNILAALLEREDVTLLHIMTVLSNEKYRNKVIEETKDPIVKNFWANDFSNKNKNFHNEAVSPIESRIGKFMNSIAVRHTLSQTGKVVDINDVVNNKKILLVDVSKGYIGEDSSRLLGSLVVILIQLAVMRRVTIPEGERVPFFLYIDECHNFTTPATNTILSETRKYKLGLILAHQYMAQLPHYLQKSLLGNVGTTICFSLGADDAYLMSRQFTPEIQSEDFQNLEKYQIILRLMIDGMASSPFTAETLPPIVSETNFSEAILKNHAKHYTQSHKKVSNMVVNTLAGK